LSARRLPRGAHPSQPTRRECDRPAGANRHIWLVGKQSTISNRRAARSIPLFAELSSSLCLLHRRGSLPSPPQQDLHLGRTLSAGQIRSALSRLVRSSCNSATAWSTRKLFSCHGLSRGVRSTPLTRRSSERKMAAHSGTSKRSSLCKSPNGPVAGLSPENVES
jgi:hypothetical protein